MSLDKNPHAWINVQNSSIRPEGPPLWFPVRERERSNQHQINVQNIIPVTTGLSFAIKSLFGKLTYGNEHTYTPSKGVPAISMSW